MRKASDKVRTHRNHELCWTWVWTLSKRFCFSDHPVMRIDTNQVADRCRAPTATSRGLDLADLRRSSALIAWGGEQRPGKVRIHGDGGDAEGLGQIQTRLRRGLAVKGIGTNQVDLGVPNWPRPPGISSESGRRYCACASCSKMASCTCKSPLSMDSARPGHRVAGRTKKKSVVAGRLAESPQRRRVYS
jgi:hypothetical protein